MQNPDTLEIFRKYFPYLQSGKIYFNHASISPLSTEVTDRVEDYLKMRSVTDIENYEQVMQTTAAVKENIASLVHTTPDRIAFVDNTSNGLNILAQGIQWKNGDRIILNDIEFPSNVYPFMNLRSQGVEVDFVKSKDGVVSAEDIISSITPKTRLVSISYVQFLSGYRADLAMIGDYCSRNNIIFCVDGIQGVGALQLDVHACHIDFLACGTQKWMMGLMGLAFVYISDRLQETLQPKYVGWMSVENTWELLNYDFVLKKTADAFQNGSFSVIGVAGLSGALSLFEQAGHKYIEEKILANTAYFTEQLTGLGYKLPAASFPDKHRSGIVSFKTDKAKLIFTELKKEDIVCSLREGMIRFSPHFYNTREEIDRVTDIIKKI
ncbi:MAG: aminotransferase class V-fold PLP-dependent enzyme [Ignavibacteriales bacterium]|nr:MAG: aminotransferase class V-fold PLP-dependent enzyme [Ignavibacteriales bacterium]